jgi:hypothetical protein
LTGFGFESVYTKVWIQIENGMESDQKQKVVGICSRERDINFQCCIVKRNETQYAKTQALIEILS